jgi:hypothetical protein
MTTPNPDEMTAKRLAGEEPPAPTQGALKDASLIDDPEVRPPLVLNDRSFTEVRRAPW